MDLSVETRKVDGVVVLDLSGRVTAGEAVQLFRKTVRQFIDEGRRKFLVNLGGVSFIDSSGLGEFVTTYASLQSRGGEIKLLNLKKRIKDLLQMTKLLTVFDCHDDEAAALRSFT